MGDEKGAWPGIDTWCKDFPALEAELATLKAGSP
jgi:hypothetical protein